MTITELVRELLELRQQQGDIEVVRADGRPFTFIAVDEQRDGGKWNIVVQKDLR